MKDGYYVSAFVVAGELQAMLDIKLRHDQAFALWRKSADRIELVAYWELERFSGWKQHTYTFSSKKQILNVLEYLLGTVNLELSDIQEIWGSPVIDTGKHYDSSEDYQELAYHSICHLFTSLLFDSNISKNEEMLILSLDSGPDNIVQLDGYNKKYYVGAYVSHGQITIFPIHSPGKIWSNSKKRFGLREGSLMALASACDAVCYEDFSGDVDLFDENALGNALDYLDRLAIHIESVGYKKDDRFTERENYISAFMKQVDRTSKNIMIKEIDSIINKYSICCKNVHLGLAGGYTLNCPTNTFLMDRYEFKSLIIPPCPNDCGEALGIGLYGFYKKMNCLPDIKISHPFYGNPAENITPDILEKYKLFIKSVDDVEVEKIAEDIENDVVIWVQGRSEIGPRALGHRSIFGNPAKIEVKSRLNQIKQRQWWRPVAPIVLEEKVEELFLQRRKSPFMLEAFDVKQNWKTRIPAVLHLDGTARVQTLCENDNKLLHDVIWAFYLRTGVPAVCNTSLNDKGEPIIQSTEEAICFGLKKKIKKVYVNGKRVTLHNFHLYEDIGKESRNTKLFVHPTKEEVEEMCTKQNPFRLSKDTLTYYFDNPEMYLYYDLTKEADCKIIENKARNYMDKYLISLKRDIL